MNTENRQTLKELYEDLANLRDLYSRGIILLGDVFSTLEDIAEELLEIVSEENPDITDETPEGIKK